MLTISITHTPPRDGWYGLGTTVVYLPRALICPNLGEKLSQDILIGAIETRGFDPLYESHDVRWETPTAGVVQVDVHWTSGKLPDDFLDSYSQLRYNPE